MADTGDARWLSYNELAQVRGIKREAAKRLSFRRQWARRVGNDGAARVCVPTSELKVVQHDTGDYAVTTPVLSPVMTPVSEPALVDILRAQVVDLIAQRDQATAQVVEARADADQARQGREDARVRAARAEGQASALREALAEAQRPFWRRWLG